ncbi:hypothetical protein BHE74_00004228 [Ensete ventricosum]|nr:hypothetical protein GW17_00018410 [Ensete ventricosum]RWW86972.1 hypothetical protein BHE74_00004228 [Ensete ventricosum]
MGRHSLLRPMLGRQPRQHPRWHVHARSTATLASEVEASGWRASSTVAARAINATWCVISSPHISVPTDSPYNLITPKVTTKKEGRNEPHGSCFRVSSSGPPAMETLIPEICRLLNDTLSPEKAVLASATDGLDRLSRFPHFPLSLLAVATGRLWSLFVGGDSQGLRLAAAAYLKNFVRSCMDDNPQSLELQRFRNQLAQALLQAEPAVLKVLVEVVCS